MRLPRVPQRRLLPSTRALAVLAGAVSLAVACAGSDAQHDRRSTSPAAWTPPSSLASAVPPPRDELLALAWSAYSCGRSRGVVRRPVLGVIDYSLPSTRPRFWLIDGRSGRVERNEFVTHGQGSGDVRATRFSNTPGSFRSSLGLFVTGETYMGRHGVSLRLHGLEPGENDAAYDRAIVMHGAWYATAEHAARFGRLGRSLGCPAFAPDVAPEVLAALADGAALFIYGDDPEWLAHQPPGPCGAVAEHPEALDAAPGATVRVGGVDWRVDRQLDRRTGGKGGGESDEPPGPASPGFGASVSYALPHELRRQSRDLRNE